MPFEPSDGMSREEVEEEVGRVIDENHVTLFMKGSELMPQCGFSRSALNILQRYEEDVHVVNVLDGPLEVYRDVLEERTGWSTIPQAFADGEFIGGADVLEQLDETGELAGKIGSEPEEVPF